ncbi:peptide ABC transporter substrate-binding protein [Taklimakanibacter deserti]|uniref:peptide ABC transporter substrate-binding protein n=1 Tax=Taklimakanibacter deserti TaxID=2267839 RepID=UPI000E64B857
MSDIADEFNKASLNRRELLRSGSLLGLTVPLAGGLGAAALSNLAATPAQAAAGQLVIGVTQEAVNFNPLLYVNTGVETSVEFIVFDALWKFDPSGKLIANLAAEIPTAENGGISADGLTWTIKLRPGVKWHDGKPFSSADVIFTLDVIRDPKVVVRSRNGHEHVESYEAVDDNTVRIKLKDSFAPYVVSWQKTSIIPKHILSGIDINTAPFNVQPIGTGPFKFKSRVAGSHIEFEPNPDYHGGAPKLTSLIQKYVPDQQTLYAQFQTGEVDIYELQGIPPLLYAKAKQLPNCKVEPSASPFVEFIYFNCGKPQFQDKRVRKALYMAIDKKGWIDAVYYGVPIPSLSYLPPNHWAYNNKLVDPGFDPVKAAALLDEAGWKVGDDGVRAKDGVRLAFTMSTTAGNKAREQAQQLVQQNLKKVNVEMTIKNMPASVVWGDYTVKSEFDTLMVGWDALLYPDPDYGDRIISKSIPAKGGSGSNYVQYENPEIDELCAKGVATVKQEDRKAIYDRIQEILLEDLPFAPIFAYQTIVGVKDRVGGYVLNPYTPINTWNPADWTAS